MRAPKARLLCRRHLSQRLRPALADTGISRQLAFRLRRPDAGLRAFGNQGTLELRHGAEHLQRKHALRRRRVDRILQRPEMRVPGGQLLDHLEQVADRTRQAIEPDDDERVAGADLADDFGEGRADARGAGSVLLDDRLAAGRAQLHLLRFGRLLVGRDARIADQPGLWSTGSAILRVNDHLQRLRVRFGSGFPNTEDTDNRSVELSSQYRRRHGGQKTC